MTIPVADPVADNTLISDELEAAVQRVVVSGPYVLGPEVESFEREFASFVGTRFAVGVASGTDAVTLALRACDVGPGAEVITASHTAGATVAAILKAGATPVLVDIDRETMTIDPVAIEAAVSRHTRAIVPVHLYGGAADLAVISNIARSHGLLTIEDCAQAHGTTVNGSHVGSRSDAGAFSFYPTKNLGGIGDGGMVVTSRADLAEKLMLLRQHGWRRAQVSELVAGNSRLDELQAAILRVKLRHLPEFLAARRRIAATYRAAIRAPDLRHPARRPGVEHSYHLYVVRSPARDALADALTDRGIATGIHYPVPVHRQPAYRSVCSAQALPETDRAAQEILSLPMFAGLHADAVAAVVSAVNDAGLHLARR